MKEVHAGFLKQFSICLAGEEVKYGAFYHHVEAESTPWGGGEVVSRYGNMYLLSRHRHIHNSELYRGKVYSEKGQMLPLPWFLQWNMKPPLTPLGSILPESRKESDYYWAISALSPGFTSPFWKKLYWKSSTSLKACWTKSAISKCSSSREEKEERIKCLDIS